MSENKKMTPAILENIAKKHLQNYMKDVKEHGGIDHEQALYAAFLEIVVTLEVQHGKTDAKKVLRSFVDDLYATS